MPTSLNVDGTAALAIVEALLLALNDRKVLPEGEIVGILHDAANAHTDFSKIDDPNGVHAAVAVLINKIITGGNSVRR